MLLSEKNKFAPYELKLKEQYDYFVKISRRKRGQHIPKLLLCPKLMHSIIEKCTDESSGDIFYLVDWFNNWGKSWIEGDLLKGSSRGRKLVTDFEKSLDGAMDTSL